MLPMPRGKVRVRRCSGRRQSHAFLLTIKNTIQEKTAAQAAIATRPTSSVMNAPNPPKMRPDSPINSRAQFYVSAGRMLRLALVESLLQKQIGKREAKSW